LKAGGRYNFKNKYKGKFESDGNRNGRRASETPALMVAAPGDCEMSGGVR
jgi:hypothetical protein